MKTSYPAVSTRHLPSAKVIVWKWYTPSEAVNPPCCKRPLPTPISTELRQAMTDTAEIQPPEDKPLETAGRVYQSRLLVGNGKYHDLMETGHAIEASGAEIVTVAVRRTNLGQNPDEPKIGRASSPSTY